MLGVGEEEAGLDAQHDDARHLLVVGVARDVDALALRGGGRPSTATFGCDARYSSSTSEMAMPMNSPGSVSKIRTPSIAATAAMKSARAAWP